MIGTVKTSTKFFALAPLVFILLSKTLLLIGNSESQPVAWISYIALAFFIFYLIIENKKADWIYSLALVLFLLGRIGGLFRIMHWPFAGVMMIGDALGTFMILCLFLYNAVKESKNIQYVQLLLSVCLFIQLTIAMYDIVFYRSFGLRYIQYLYFPVAVLCGTILLQNRYKRLGERNLILYLLVQSLFIIIKQLFKLFA